MEAVHWGWVQGQDGDQDTVPVMVEILFPDADLVWVLVVAVGEDATGFVQQVLQQGSQMFSVAQYRVVLHLTWLLLYLKLVMNSRLKFLT